MILDGGYVYGDDIQCANDSNIEYMNICPMSKKIECDDKVSDWFNLGFITNGSRNGICENKTIIYDPYCEGRIMHFWNMLPVQT